MNKEEMQRRTRRFAVQVIHVVEALPRGRANEVLGRQLLRAATSVAANYRAACRAKSNADWLSKMGTVEEEADESLFWMELLVGAGLVEHSRLVELIVEANAILAMIVASIKTARNRKQ